MEQTDFSEDILYFEEIPGAVTVCDTRGMILYMNAKARKTFKDGDYLIGKSLLDCHPEPARSKLIDLLEHPRTNSYTIEKNSNHKWIQQVPWYRFGKFAGLIEFSFEIPEEIPHFIRAS
jgi:transcriptional regulator with PAS, ATPase and Fis domain